MTDYSKKSIAVHYFGHLRTFKECIPSHIEKIFSQNYHFDIFMHTWDENDRRTPSWYEVGSVRSVTPDEIQMLKHALNPINIIIETQNADILTSIPYISSRRMHESLRKSIGLRTSTKGMRHYDLVATMRPDIKLNSTIPIGDLVELVKSEIFKNSVFSASYSHKADGLFQTDRMGARDCICFGSESVMNKFEYIGLEETIYVKHPRQNGTGEIFFDNFVRNSCLSWQPIEYTAPVDWEIVREMVTEANRTYT